MKRLRDRIRKVLTGIAALLLAGLQFLGSIEMPHMPMHYGMMGYTWTDQGIRAQVMHEQEKMARLEGEVHEDQLRTAMVREREDKEKAAS